MIDSKLNPPELPSNRVWFGCIDEWEAVCGGEKYDYIHIDINKSFYSCLNIFSLSKHRLVSEGVLILSVSISEFFGHERAFNILNIHANSHGFTLLSRRQLILSVDITYRLSSKNRDEDYEISSAKNNDIDCIKLFEQVFDERMPREFWNWKYSNNGEDHSVIAKQNGKVCGHYGGTPRTLVFLGREYASLQAGDVCISKKHRSFFLKSLFYQLATVFIKNAFNGGIKFIFGFPHSKAYRLGKRLGLYKQASEIYQLVLAGQYNGRVSESCFLKLNIDEADFNIIFEGLNCSLSSSNMSFFKRDSCFFMKRYINHPVYTYELFFCRDYNTYLVIRKNNQTHILMDFYGDIKFLGLSLRVFSLEVALEGESIAVWLTTCMLDISGLTDMVSSLDKVAMFTYNQSASVDHAGFWITAGDTDFL